MATWKDCEGNTRRDFLKIGTAGVMGLGLADLLRLQAQAAPDRKATAKNVIMVWLAGGPATIDMWDLKPDAPKNIRGEFKPINTSAKGVQICEHLPLMAKVIDKCTIVRSLKHTIPSHGPGTVYMHTGHKPTPAIDYPSIGSIMARLLETPKGVPPYVTFGRAREKASTAGYLGPAYNPFEIEGRAEKGQLRVRGLSLPSGFTLRDLDDRNKLLQTFDARFDKLETSADILDGLDGYQQQALDILRAETTKKAFDLGQESDKLRNRYGKDSFGQATLVARRLIDAGVRFVSVSTGGWDTHSNNFKSLKGTRLPQLDRPLSALIEDLDQRGMLDSTIVYCVGEFARTPKVNGKGGRDHWARSMSVLLAGGGFKRGFAYGSTDKEGKAPNRDACEPDDLYATIFRCLGIDYRRQLMTTSGRPLAIFRDAVPLGGLLA